MKLRDKALTTIMSVSMLSGMAACSSPNNNNIEDEPDKNQTEIFEKSPVFILEIPKEDLSKLNKNNDTTKIKEKTAEQISVCLNTDDENSFTHKKVLESINDSENTILEFPLSQLFQKYGNRPHPLAVRGIDKNLTSLLGEYGIEELSGSIPQKLSPRKEKITSETQYEAGDTLRFSLIDPFLQGAFPQNLSDQLKEDGFESFSDSDASDLAKKIKENQNSENIDKESDFIYDIVVKKLPSGEGVLALYRDGKLFMATYVSVGLNSRKTKTGQFEILWTNPYYFSRKYKSPMSCCVYYDNGGRGGHQGKVIKKKVLIEHRGWVIKRGFPASHGCVRLPGVYALSLYSLVKGKKHVDVFISKNLYN